MFGKIHCNYPLVNNKRTLCTTSNTIPKRIVKPREEVRTSTQKPDPILDGVPMNKPWPNTSIAKTSSSLLKPTIKISKLDNGVRVVTQDILHTPGAAVGITFGSGSRNETPEYRGYAWMSEKMAFKSSRKYASSEILPMMEYYGANAYSSAHRESINVCCESLVEYIPSIVDLLYESTYFIENVPEEFEEQRQLMLYHLNEAHLYIDSLLLEWVHTKAYDETPIGNPIHAPLEVVNELTFEKMREWQNQQFVAENLVVTGLGINHQQFVEIVQKTFGNLPRSGLINVNDKADFSTSYLPAYNPPANYIGGELYIQDERKNEPTLFAPYEMFDACVFLVFEAPSNYGVKDFYSVCLLLSLMGSGGSFSSGGPGKGMYSRTYTDILCYGFVESASTFHFPYSDTGLFGICIHGRQNRLHNIIELAVVGMQNMAKIKPEEFERAKNQLKSVLFSNLETRSVILEDLQRQTLLYNNYYDQAFHISQIDALSIEDVENFAKRMLTDKLPTFVVYAEEEYMKNLPTALAINKFLKENLGV